MTYSLRDEGNKTIASNSPGTIGGHSKLKIWGELDCPSANRWLGLGHYKKHRVFFENETVAEKAGYRPCGVCNKTKYLEWKQSKQNKPKEQLKRRSNREKSS